MSQRKVNSEKKIEALQKDLNEVDFEKLLLEEEASHEEKELNNKVWEQVFEDRSIPGMVKLPKLLRRKSTINLNTFAEEEEGKTCIRATISAEPSNGVSTSKETSANLETLFGADVLTAAEGLTGKEQASKVFKCVDGVDSETSQYMKEIDINPTFGPKIPNNTIWETSEPIFLVSQNFGFGLFKNISGIKLGRGVYKILYTLTNIYPGTGLALFDQGRKTLNSVIFYLPVSGRTKPVTHDKGEILLNLNKEELLAVCSSTGAIRPTFFGAFRIIIQKRVITPN